MMMDTTSSKSTEKTVQKKNANDEANGIKH